MKQDTMHYLKEVEKGPKATSESETEHIYFYSL